MADKQNKATASEFRFKTDKELSDRVLELRKEQFNLRFQRANGQLSNTARVRDVRREVSRILTVLGERARGVDHKTKGQKAV